MMHWGFNSKIQPAKPRFQQFWSWFQGCLFYETKVLFQYLTSHLVVSPSWQVAGDAETAKESLAQSEEASRNLRSFKKKQRNRKERSHDISQTTEEASPIKASSCDNKKAEMVNDGAHTAGLGDILSILKGATVGYKFRRKLSKTLNREHLGHISVNIWKCNIDIHCFYTLQCRCLQRRSCWGSRIHFEWYREPQE